MRKNNEIQKELDEISPTLASISNEEVFTVPEGYFEQLSLNLIPELKENNPNEVPEGYFDDFSTNLINKIGQTPKIVSINKYKLIYNIAAAAVVIGLISWGIYFMKNQNSSAADYNSLAMQEARQIIKNNTFESEINNLSDEEVVNYLEENGHDVNAALVASLSDDTGLPYEVDFINNEKELDTYLDQKNIH